MGGRRKRVTKLYSRLAAKTDKPRGEPAKLPSGVGREPGPFRLPVKHEGIRLGRCPMGPNAQVPANWAFLQVLAQSRR